MARMALYDGTYAATGAPDLLTCCPEVGVLCRNDIGPAALPRRRLFVTLRIYWPIT
jgi:hypothetical protein